MVSGFVSPTVLLRKNEQQAHTCTRYEPRRLLAASAGTSSVGDRSEVILTHYGNHSFTLEGGGGGRLLVDPAFVDQIDIGPRDWAVGILEDDCVGIDVVGNYDGIVLTQNLPDHTHEPTLREMVKQRPDVPIVAPLEALAFLRRIGFNDVQVARPRDRIELAGVSITVGKGTQWPYFAPMLALMFDFNGLGVYYEAHGHPSKKFLEYCAAQEVDAVITPGVDFKIVPSDFHMIIGADSALKIARELGPTSLVLLNSAPRKRSGRFGPNAVTVDNRDIVREAFANDEQLKNIRLIEPARRKEGVTIASNTW